MSTPDLDLLALVQWLSPAFPTGAYAYSHGLEQAVVAGEVRTEAELGDWLSDILEHGAGWNDAVLLACGLRGADLAALHPVIAQLAARAATATPADLAQSAFRAEIAAAAHETLEVRIFKT